MKFQRIQAIIKKELTRIVKDPAILFILVIFPIVLTLAFGFSFGQIGSTTEETYAVTLINEDNSGEFSEWAEHFQGNLSEREILTITLSTDQSAAEQDLLEGKISALITIPNGFGEAIDSYWQHPTDPSLWTNISVNISYDSGSLIVSQLLPSVFQQALIETIFGDISGSLELPVCLDASLVASEQLTMFDYMVPGLFAFATIFLTMTVAQSITQEKELGLLKRMQLTPITSGELVLGLTIANVLAALVQIGVISLMAIVLGYNIKGGLLFAFLLMAIFSITNVGFGLITGAVSKNAGMATGISFIFIILMFLIIS